MNIAPVRVTALKALGYTELEARFLYLVATHSGCFVPRQFLAFAGTHWRKRASRFGRKLRSKNHARLGRLPDHGTFYHVFARRVYRQIGSENPCNNRRHGIEHVEARIAVLDFVLGNPCFSYLEAEAEKVGYFNGELNVGVQHLPSRTYQRGSTVQPAVRYFLNCFPMFFEDRNSAPPVVTFSFIQGPEASLRGFVHHLKEYLPLFRELSEFRFLFLAPWDSHFRKARELFHSLVTIPLEPHPADDLLRYFAIRKAWDLREYAALSEADLIFRNLAKQRFSGLRFERFYWAWRAGQLTESRIRCQLPGSEMPHVAHFETQILKPCAPPAAPRPVPKFFPPGQAELQKLNQEENQHVYHQEGPSDPHA